MRSPSSRFILRSEDAMRLTALCICGTLLAFSSPSWIMADEGILLDLDTGFGPCTATLTPEEPCRQGPHEGTCPYIFSLPPLTVQLPQQLRELERIVQDLEKLKDSVDELREMCADCTVSKSERVCASQREHEKQTEGEDERSWMNERLQESDRDYRQEGGAYRGTENTEGDGDFSKSFSLEEKDMKKQDAERERDKQVIKEFDHGNLDTKLTEKYGKTLKEGTNEKDRLEQTKMPNSGGDEHFEYPDIETGADKNNRKITTDRNIPNTRKESFKKYQEDKVEKEKERRITTNVKNKDKLEKSEHHEGQYETKETETKTQTESNDRVKMFEDHGAHTNRKPGERVEKRREKGTNVERNNEKPKQTEGIGRAEKETTVKVEELEEEGRETGEEIKTQGEKTERAQGKSDGVLSSSKPIERTDFVSSRPTPDSTISRASSPDSSDSNKAIIFTSSLPRPSLPSSTSAFSTDVSHETLAAYEPTASGSSETQSPDAESDTAAASIRTLGGPGQQISTDTLKPSSEVKPRAGFNGGVSSTTATTAHYENVDVTAAPQTRGNSRWTTNKNISSNTKSGIKPVPGRGPKPGAKHKHEPKSEAGQELKNSRNERKPEGAFPDKRIKNIQKQKPSLPKSTTNQSKPANNPKQVHIIKQDQPKYDRERAPGQNKKPVEIPKTNSKSVSPTQRRHQKQPTANTTHLDRYPLVNQMEESEETPDENSKPGRELFYPVKTTKSDVIIKPEMRQESEDATPDRSFNQNQDQSPVHEPELRRSEMTILTPNPKQNVARESTEKTKGDPSLEPTKQDSFTQKNDPNQKITTLNQRPITESMKETDDNPLLDPTSNQQKITPDQASPLPSQKQTPDQDIVLFHQEPVTESDTNPIFIPKSHDDSTQRGRITPDKGNTGLDQTFQSSRGIPVINAKSVTDSAEKSNENFSYEFGSNPHVKPEQKYAPDRTIRLPDQEFVHTEKILKINQNGTANITAFIEKYDKNSSRNHTVKEDSTSDLKITPDRGNTGTGPYQRFKPNEQIPPNYHNPNRESVEESDKTPTTKLTNIPDSTPGQTISSDQVKTKPDQKLTPHQNTPKVHREFGTESIPKDEEKPTFQPISNKDSTPDEKMTSHVVDTHPNQRFNTSVTKMDRSGENPSLHSKINKDSTPGLKTTPEQVDPRPNRRLEPNEEIPTIDQYPVIDSMEKSDRNPTFKPTFSEEPTPGQKIKINQGKTLSYPRNEFIESAEENTSFESLSNPELAPDQKPDQAQTLTDKKLQGIPTVDKHSVTQSMERSDKNSPFDSSMNKESTPGYKITPEQINTRLDQTFKPSKIIPKLNQKTMTDSMKKSDENPSVDLSSSENSSPGQRGTLHQVNTPADEKLEDSQKTPTINQRSRAMSENNPLETVSNPEITDQGGTLPDQKLRPIHNIPSFNQESVTESMKRSDGDPSHETASKEHSTLDQKMTPDQDNTRQDQKFKLNQEIVTINRKPENETMEKNEKNPTLKSTSNRDSTPGRKISPERVNTRLDQRFKPNMKNPKVNQRPKPGQGLKPNQKLSKSVTDLKTKPNVGRKTDQAPRTNQQLKTPRPHLNSKSQPDEVSRGASNKTSKHPPLNRFPVRPRVKPEATPVQRPKPVQLQPNEKTESNVDLPAVSWTTSDGIQNSQTGMPPASGPGKDIAAVSHSLKGKELNPSMRKAVTLAPKTATSLETGPFNNHHTLSEDFTVSLNSRTMSNLKTQTISQPSSTPTTSRSVNRMLPSDISSTDQGSSESYPILKSASSSQANKLQNVEGTASTIPSPSFQMTPPSSTDYRSTTSPTSGLEPSGAESSTPSARELRVKINQVAAFFNNSLSSNGRQAVRHPKQHPGDTQGGNRPDRTETPVLIPSKVSSVMRDCSDHLLRGHTDSGVYLVTPDLRSRSFPVYCDMEREGGGWTVLQRRLDGSVSFNRSWAEYQSGFGDLHAGEFWLGNSLIHLLTRERDMTLRVELQDFDGVEEHAQYALFRVASERLRYRLTVGGYSGTAGDALRFNKQYDHNNRAFTTPDRDHDRYPSGNCGAYYSSGWWFDACMAANLNGRYYEGSYKGVRDGIFWGTWHNISTEYYPTNDRQSFKSVRMMIRPKGFAP